MMPTLEYDQSCCANIGSLGFEEFCKRSLQLHEAPVLKTLTLKVKLHTVSPYFADSLASTVCFQYLRSLHLAHVRFLGEDAFCRLIWACPVLEDLFLESTVTSGFPFNSPSLLTISVPSLQRLEINEKQNTCSVRSNYPSERSRYKINTPSLKYLKLWIKDFIGCFELEDMPNLVEARLGVDPDQTDEFLRFLTSAQFLSIHICATEVLSLAEIISQRLLHLELNIYGKISRNLLLHLLKHSPKLQFLKLQETQMTITMPTYPRESGRLREFDDPLPSIGKPSSVPECVSFHLETFQWLGYKGREKEKEIVLYILQNALCLKTVVVSLSSYGPRRGEELLMIKELESMPKVSTSCKLVARLR